MTLGVVGRWPRVQRITSTLTFWFVMGRGSVSARNEADILWHHTGGLGGGRLPRVMTENGLQGQPGKNIERGWKRKISSKAKEENVSKSGKPQIQQKYSMRASLPLASGEL
ncbi:hypothetical protein E2C01_027689 [Portunus trituberculatus]|uniref:Uncharacterized protein n=1 Tax=Portunus trituberculatus TaxID=210409 RepID=A0A5B7ELJ5_PORTR|nr:hypothetical protein [Portunus trituberculatus]